MAITVLPVRKERVVHGPYAVLAGLQVLDVATTGFLLHHFAGAVEGNPITRAIFTGLGLAVGLLVVLWLKLAAVVLFWECQTRVHLATAIYSVVLLNNVVLGLLWVLKP